jgi:hypothetical protein
MAVAYRLLVREHWWETSFSEQSVMINTRPTRMKGIVRVDYFFISVPISNGEWYEFGYSPSA